MELSTWLEIEEWFTIIKEASYFPILTTIFLRESQVHIVPWLPWTLKASGVPLSASADSRCTWARDPINVHVE